MNNKLFKILATMFLVVAVFASGAYAQGKERTEAQIIGIKQFLVEYSNALRSNSEVDAFYAVDYGLHDGMTKEHMLSLDKDRIIGILGFSKITDVNITGERANNGRAVIDVEIDILLTDGEIYKIRRSITRENNKWEFIGNSRLFHVDIGPEAIRWVAPHSITLSTGISIHITQLHDSDLWTFIVKGDGLPKEGVRMVRRGENGDITLSDNYINAAGLAGRWLFYALTDEMVQKVKNASVYTISAISAYNSKDALIETQTVKIHRHPLRLSEIHDSDFSSLTLNPPSLDFRELLNGDNSRIHVNIHPPRSYTPSFIYLDSALINRNGSSRTFVFLPSSETEAKILRDKAYLSDTVILTVLSYKKGVFFITSYIYSEVDKRQGDINCNPRGN